MNEETVIKKALEEKHRQNALKENRKMDEQEFEKRKMEMNFELEKLKLEVPDSAREVLKRAPTALTFHYLLICNLTSDIQSSRGFLGETGELFEGGGKGLIFHRCSLDELSPERKLSPCSDPVF
ncbi:hypothetical protein CDAR_617581 [Caerostris darwini]|uniref:Uncharacterized protein n=1 Tax=Caerostris darwini TaxID=1538125 RepID=A0AAV4VTK2_9ARAC|nr:hypothetical protein CDAR_617581 [Caerostris darwini]